MEVWLGVVVLFGFFWRTAVELSICILFRKDCAKESSKGENKKHTILVKKLMKEHSAELNGHQAHVLSFPTFRSRRFPLAFHCEIIKANIVMLTNLQHMGWECCKIETYIPSSLTLLCPSSSNLVFALLTSKIVLHSHLFSLNLFIFWPSCFRGSILI